MLTIKRKLTLGIFIAIGFFIGIGMLSFWMQKRYDENIATLEVQIEKLMQEWRR